MKIPSLSLRQFNQPPIQNVPIRTPEVQLLKQMHRDVYFSAREEQADYLDLESRVLSYGIDTPR